LDEGACMFTGIDNLGLFIAAGVVLNLTPGPDVLYILTHALNRGWRTGAVAALGITTGCFVHIAAAALGVSALMAASSSTFSVLKWLGAAYLVYIGWSMLGTGKGRLAQPEKTATMAPAPQHLRAVFVKGFWTNALNPKVALFFLAFLPQFMVPGTEHTTATFLLLGLIFNFNSLWVNLAYAALGAGVSHRFVALQSGMAWLERFAGTLFIGFGLKLALTDNPVP
jgi:threonine/homoserine/homoserine lactone efflux protein